MASAFQFSPYVPSDDRSVLPGTASSVRTFQVPTGFAANLNQSF